PVEVLTRPDDQSGVVLSADPTIVSEPVVGGRVGDSGTSQRGVRGVRLSPRLRKRISPPIGCVVVAVVMLHHIRIRVPEGKVRVAREIIRTTTGRLDNSFT